MQNKIKLGVDIDGVLANQISTLLPIINKKYSLNLTYNDIDDWRKKIKDTDIANLIIEAQRNDDYLLEIPLIDDSSEILSNLSPSYEIYILTAREICTKEATLIWLKSNNIIFDYFYNLKEENKQKIEVDIIIDDYKGNIEKYLNSHENSFAILYKQPWNYLEELENFITSKRCHVAYTWKQIPGILNNIEALRST